MMAEIDFELLKQGLHGLEVAASQFATAISRHENPPEFPKDNLALQLMHVGQALSLPRLPFFALENARNAIKNIEKALGIKQPDPPRRRH